MNCPLTGKPCNHDKNVHFVQNTHDNKIDTMICDQCTQANIIFQTLLTTNLFQIFKNAPTDKHAIHNDSGVICSGCNCSLQEIRLMGRLGCPKCYETFREYLEPVLQRAHGSLIHNGKTIKSNKQFIFHSIEDLKNKLKLAVKDEKYEDASILRDAIKRLEQQIKPKDL